MSGGGAVDAMTEQLVAAGMSPAAAASKGKLLEHAIAALGGEPTVAWYVPGRIEFLGKHTDYAGGRSLLCAVEQGFCLVARPRADATIHMTAAATGEGATFALDPHLTPVVGHWSNYPMTVASRLAANFTDARVGADVAFASDLPPAAGMSSSSALVVGTFSVLAQLNDLAAQPAYRKAIQSQEDLCGYLGTIENGQNFGPLVGSRGVGTFGGSQDHTAIVCAAAGKLVQYSFKPVVREAEVPLPAGHVFVIASSGVDAEKTREARDKYNRVSRTVGVILEQWHRAGGVGDSLAQAIRSSPDALERLSRIVDAAEVDGFTPAELLARVRQFEQESEQIIPQTAAALAAGQLGTLGNLVDASQRGAEQALSNQVPETAFLAAAARESGATAASAFGAGFGGSVWALVPLASADAFQSAWSAAYATRFPESASRSRFFQTAAGPAATRLL